MFFKHRVARNRFMYFTVLIAALFGFAYVVEVYDWRLYQLAVIAVIFLIPGRVVQFFWRDFFRGRRQLESGQISEAIDSLERFLQTVSSSPWIKGLMFFTYGLYSFRIEAVALTYLGRAYLHQKNMEKAATCLAGALQVDSKYSVAMFYQAVYYRLNGDTELAAQGLAHAMRHGYRKASDSFFEDEVGRFSR